MVLKFLLYWQIKQILSNSLLAGQFFCQFQWMAVIIINFYHNEIILLSIKVIWRVTGLLLMINKHSTTQFISTTVYYFIVVSSVKNSFLEQLPFAITNLHSILQQKGTYLIGTLKFLVYYLVLWISCCVLVLLQGLSRLSVWFPFPHACEHFFKFIILLFSFIIHFFIIKANLAYFYKICFKLEPGNILICIKSQLVLKG